jgi:hypothetical protein
MLQVYIPITQCWKTVDDAVEYFEKLKGELLFYKNAPEEITELYLDFNLVGEGENTCVDDVTLMSG